MFSHRMVELVLAGVGRHGCEGSRKAGVEMVWSGGLELKGTDEAACEL